MATGQAWAILWIWFSFFIFFHLKIVYYKFICYWIVWVVFHTAFNMEEDKILLYAKIILNTMTFGLMEIMQSEYLIRWVEYFSPYFYAWKLGIFRNLSFHIFLFWILAHPRVQCSTWIELNLFVLMFQNIQRKLEEKKKSWILDLFFTFS